MLKLEQVQGRDVFLWLPTRFGKSICYEVLPFLIVSECSTLVVAWCLLVVDQVARFRSRGGLHTFLVVHDTLYGENRVFRAYAHSVYQALCS